MRRRARWRARGSGSCGLTVTDRAASPNALDGRRNLDRYVLEKWINKRVQRDWGVIFLSQGRHLSLPHEISI